MSRGNRSSGTGGPAGTGGAGGGSACVVPIDNGSSARSATSVRCAMAVRCDARAWGWSAGLVTVAADLRKTTPGANGPAADRLILPVIARARKAKTPPRQHDCTAVSATDYTAGSCRMRVNHARTASAYHACRQPRGRAGLRVGHAAARPVDAGRLHARRHPGRAVHAGLRRRCRSRVADGRDRRDPADVRRRHAFPSAGTAARVAHRGAGRHRAERGRHDRRLGVRARVRLEQRRGLRVRHGARRRQHRRADAHARRPGPA